MKPAPESWFCLSMRFLPLLELSFEPWSDFVLDLLCRGISVCLKRIAELGTRENWREPSPENSSDDEEPHGAGALMHEVVKDESYERSGSGRTSDKYVIELTPG